MNSVWSSFLTIGVIFFSNFQFIWEYSCIDNLIDFRIQFLIDLITIVDMPSNPQLFLFGRLFIICITFVSLTCSNRSIAFQIVHWFSVPVGRRSSALCTLTCRASSSYFHNSMRAAFDVLLMGSVHLIKLLRDFRRGTTPRCPLSGCHWSVVCRVRSVRIAIAKLSEVELTYTKYNASTIKIKIIYINKWRVEQDN